MHHARFSRLELTQLIIGFYLNSYVFVDRRFESIVFSIYNLNEQGDLAVLLPKREFNMHAI